MTHELADVATTLFFDHVNAHAARNDEPPLDDASYVRDVAVMSDVVAAHFERHALVRLLLDDELDSVTLFITYMPAHNDEPLVVRFAVLECDTNYAVICDDEGIDPSLHER